jgi:hypothetical protein
MFEYDVAIDRCRAGVDHASIQCNIDRVTARYRLAPAREARVRDERERRSDLAGAVAQAHAMAGDAAAAADRVATSRTAIATAAAARDRLLTAGATAAALARLERYQARLRRELDAARGEQLRIEARHRGQLDAVDAARDRLTLARAQRDVIERHFAAWRDARRKLAERRED